MPAPETFAKCACQNCGGHIEFPIQGAGQNISCPHCHFPTILILPQTRPVEIGGGRAARKRIYLIFAIAISLVALAGVFAYLHLNSQNSQPETATPAHQAHTPDATSIVSAPVASSKRKPADDPWHGLKVSKVTLEKTSESHLVYATGTLTNDTTRQRFGVKVQFDILDAHRNKIGSATDYTEVMEPGKEWKFRALVTDKAAIAAKLNSIKEQE